MKVIAKRALQTYVTSDDFSNTFGFLTVWPESYAKGIDA